MQKIFLFLSLIIISTSYVYSYSGKVITIKSELYTRQNIIPFDSLCQTSMGFDFSIRLQKNKIFSNKELSELLHSQGYKQFTLIGEQIAVYYIPTLTDFNSFYSELSNTYKNLRLPLESDFFPKSFYVKSLDVEIQKESTILNIEYVYFSNGFDVIVSNQVFVIKRSKTIFPDETSNSITDSITAIPKVYIKNINNLKADLIYRTGNIIIRTKAKIIRKLQDNSYYVENINSGKRFEAELID